MEYPKWVQRTPHIGPVLCANAAEEKKLMEDWEAEQLAHAEEANKVAQAAAAEAKAQAELVLKNAPAKAHK